MVVVGNGRGGVASSHWPIERVAKGAGGRNKSKGGEGIDIVNRSVGCRESVQIDLLGQDVSALRNAR